MFKRALSVLFVLYCISLSSSMAGMEIFGYGATALIFAHWAWCSLTPTVFGWRDPSVKLPRLGLEWALLAMVAVVAVGAVLSPHLPLKYRIDVVGQMRWMLMLYAMTTLLMDQPDLQKRAFWVLFACFSFVSLYGIAQALFNVSIYGAPYDLADANRYGSWTVYRARGFFSNTMQLSYSLGQIVCYAFAFLFGTAFSIKQRRIIAIVFACTSIGLFFTFTRGAWLGILLAVFAMAYIWRKKLGYQVAAVLTGLIIVGMIASSGVRNRLISIIHEGPKHHSVAQRFEIWHVNWQMFKDHPLFGIGYGYNYYYAQEYNLKVFGHTGFNGNAHNNYLEVLAGSGILGFALWMWICGFFFWQTWCLYRDSKPGTWPQSLALGGLGAQIFFHFGGLTQATFFDAKPLYLLILGWGFILANRQLQLRQVTPLAREGVA